MPLRLWPKSLEKLHCFLACVIQSLYHMYEHFAAQTFKNLGNPVSMPSTLKNSKFLLFCFRKIAGNRREPMWEFSIKYKKTVLCIKKQMHRDGVGGREYNLLFNTKVFTPTPTRTAAPCMSPPLISSLFQLLWKWYSPCLWTCRHAASFSETGVPRLSCPWWLETVQWLGCARYPGPSTQWFDW